MGFVVVEGCSVGGGGGASSSTCVDVDVESGDDADADACIDDGYDALVVCITSSSVADAAGNRSSGTAPAP